MTDNKGRISIDLSDQQLTDIMGHLDAIYKLLPMHVVLTDDERRGGFRLGDKTGGFLEKGKTYMNQAPDFIPPFVDKDETFRDADFSLKMTAIVRKMQPILTEIEDMATIAGGEALASILSYYNTVKDAAKKGVPGAKNIYDDMQQRFPGRTKDASAVKAAK